MNLPFFRFHPEPLKTAAIVAEKITCECCGRDSEFKYEGPFYSEEDIEELCAECIARGEASKKFKGEFVDLESIERNCGDAVDPKLIDELVHRTPGFSGAQQERWIFFNGVPGVYEGDFCRVNAPFMTDDFWIRVKEFNEIRGQKEFEDLKNGTLLGGVSLHVFKDLNSDKRTAYFDYT